MVLSSQTAHDVLMSDGGWRKLEPATEWTLLRAAELMVEPSNDSDAGRRAVLAPGTRLRLVALWPAVDPNGACGIWQNAESAHGFRVLTGSRAGDLAEYWGWEDRPLPPDVFQPDSPQTQPLLGTALGIVGSPLRRADEETERRSG
jgi:hypothetical protein